MNDLSGVIEMLKNSPKEECKGIAIREYNGTFVYGEIKGGFIEEPIKLNIVDRSTICQDFYDALMNEFGELLEPRYSHSFSGCYEYFMIFDDRIIVFFPDGYEYSNWAANQSREDRENTRKLQNKSN